MKKITIIGRGLDPAKHLSLEAIRTLKSADIIFGIEPETESWEQIQKEFGIPKITDIGALYKNGAKDLENYDAFIEYILTATKSYENIVLLVAGHPRLGVTFAQLLTCYKKSAEFGCEIDFVEAVSSFDVMLNDLELDPLERGTSVLDANRLLLFEYQLEPSINHFIYHVCSVGTDKVHYLDPKKDNKIIALQNYLAQFYRGEKEILLCKASNGRYQNAEYISITLSELADNVKQIDFGTTLYIPADKPTKINREFYKSLQEEL